jgi:hypothetical protein
MMDSFERDWRTGASAREMAQTHGLDGPDDVKAEARRRGLPRRSPKSQGALTGGRWVPNERGVQVWEWAS